MKITINAKEIEEKRAHLTYSSICMLAKKEPFFNPTITWTIKGKNTGGTLTNGMILELEEEMVINVSSTNNA